MFNEEKFLQKMVDQNRPVIIYLVSGFQMHGTITGFDENAIEFLADDGKTKSSLVYKFAISTIEPR